MYLKLMSKLRGYSYEGKLEIQILSIEKPPSQPKHDLARKKQNLSYEIKKCHMIGPSYFTVIKI